VQIDYLMWASAEADLSAVIGINLSPNRGFRRGEGGWVDVVWAFMVARGWGRGAFSLTSQRLQAIHGGRP